MRNYLLVSALLPVVLLWNPSPGPKTTVCTKPECNTRGSLYHKNMNDKGNPCGDFFKFACGGWSKHNPKPGNQLEWTTILKMERDTLDQLKAALEKPEKHSDPQDVRRAKRVFKICAKIPSLGKGEPQFLVQNLDKIGHYPRTSISDMHNAYVKLTGESPLFDIEIIANNKHNDEPLLQFKRIESSYGSIVQLRPWTSEQTQTYLSFLVNLVMFVWKRKVPPLEDKAVVKIVSQVINFRIKLNQLTRESMAAQADPLESLTVKELQQWYNGYSTNTKRSEINWDAIVRNLYSGQSDAALLANPKVAIQRKRYFIALAKLLAETPEETIAYHFQMYFMERHMLYTPQIIEILDKIAIKMNGYTGYVRMDEIKKSLKCVKDINMDEAKGKLYVATYFEKKNIPVVADMLEELRDAIKRDITNSKWADQETKVASIRRINDISWWIGYPPSYDNPIQTGTPAHMKPATSNAHLTIAENRIRVNAAFMRSPMFDSNLPDVINYGAIGTIMGHEIYHALDDCGKFKNSKKQEITWWSKSMRDKCQIRKTCLIQQYTQVATETLKSLRLPSVTPQRLPRVADASSSYLEDLPDVMGLQTAYGAYQARLKKQKNACAVLPHFEHYNCEQMFFISFANSLCGYQVPEAAYGVGRIHSPIHLRVNGAVMNNKAFGDAFGCVKNNPMHPQDKCNLWI